MESYPKTEILNEKLKEMTWSFENYDKDNWEQNLIEFEVVYTTSVHNTTAYTHFFLNYVLNPNTVPDELVKCQKHPLVQDCFINIIYLSKQAGINSGEERPDV